MSESWGFETKQVHAGAAPDPTTGARAVPIYQTTSFVFRDTAHAAALFGLEELGDIYTRIMNPTQAVFEERVDRARGRRRRARGGERPGRADHRAAEPRRERRAHRVVARRSTAARTTSCTTRSRSWASRSASSTTPTTSTRGRPRSARTPRRSTARASATRRATSSTSRASPTVAHDNGIPLVDRQHARDRRTCCQPLAARRRHRRALGDEVHRRSRHVDRRRSSSTAASSTTPAAAASRASPSPTRATTASCSRSCPSALRPGAVHPEVPAAVPARHRRRRSSPFNAFLFLQGLETLSLRMERHSQNALAVAKWLEARDEVEWVDVPGPRRRARGTTRAQKYLPERPGRDPRVRHRGRASRPARTFIDSLELFSHLANVGDVRSLAIHPATHDAPAARRRASRRPPGVTPGPRAPVGRHRDPRRHPRRPRRRVPRREVA